MVVNKMTEKRPSKDPKPGTKVMSKCCPSCLCDPCRKTAGCKEAKESSCKK